MTIYRHFTDKDALLSALLDDLLESIPVPPAHGKASWGDRLLELHRAVVAALNTYPGLSLVMRRLPPAPNAARLLEGYLEILLSSGIDPREAFVAYTAIFYLAVGGMANEDTRSADGIIRPLSPAGQVMPNFPSALLDSVRGPAAELTQMEIQEYAIESLIAAIGSRRRTQQRRSARTRAART